MAAGDINGDGDADILFSTAYDHKINFIMLTRTGFGDHFGNFAQPLDPVDHTKQPFACFSFEHSLAVGDVSNDGYADTLITSPFGKAVSQGLGGPAGANYQPGALGLEDPLQSWWCPGVAIVDVDNDGDLDVIFYGQKNDATYTLQIFRFPSPTVKTEISLPSFPRQVVLGNFDVDPALDAVVFFPSNAMLLSNLETPTLAPLSVPGEVGSAKRRKIHGDIDELVFISNDGVLTRARPDGAGGLTGVANVTAPVIGFTTADFDRDGTDELVVCDYYEGLRFFTGTNLTPDQSMRVRCYNVIASDVTSDDYPDVLVNTSLWLEDIPRISTFVNDKTGHFPSPLGVSGSLTAADMDNDGLAELIVATPQGIEIRRRTTSGWQTSAQTSLNLSDIGVVATADIDANGYRDVVVNSPSNGILFWQQNATGFTPPTSFLPADTSSRVPSLSFADYDGDGLVDLAADGIHLATSPGVFSTIASAWGTPALPMNDYDGDGRADLIVADRVITFDGTELASVIYQPGDYRDLKISAMDDLDNDGYPDLIGTFEHGAII